MQGPGRFFQHFFRVTIVGKEVKSELTNEIGCRSSVKDTCVERIKIVNEHYRNHKQFKVYRSFLQCSVEFLLYCLCFKIFSAFKFNEIVDKLSETSVIYPKLKSGGG